MGCRSDQCDDRVKPRSWRHGLQSTDQCDDPVKPHSGGILLAVGVSPRSPRNESLDENRAAAAWDRRWMSPFRATL